MTDPDIDPGPEVARQLAHDWESLSPTRRKVILRGLRRVRLIIIERPHRQPDGRVVMQPEYIAPHRMAPGGTA